MASKLVRKGAAVSGSLSAARTASRPAHAVASISPSGTNVFESGLLGQIKADVDSVFADAEKLRAYAVKRVKSNGFTQSFQPSTLGFAKAETSLPTFAAPPFYIRPSQNAKLDTIAAALSGIRIPYGKNTTKLANGWTKLDLSPREVYRIKAAIAEHDGAAECLEYSEGEVPSDATPKTA